MESDAEITRITDVIEETLKKYDGRVIDRLDAWLFKLEAKLGFWPMDIAQGQDSTPTKLHEDTDPSVLSEVLQKDVPQDRQISASSRGRNEMAESHLIERSMTPDSYDVATQVGQSVAAAFMKLGSHSQEMAIRSGVSKAFTGFQGRMAQLAQSQAMGVFWAVIILTNSVYLGVQLEWTSKHRDDTSTAHIFTAVHVVYATLFTLEAFMQLVAGGCRAYIWGPSWAWNWLDIFVVSSSWVELVVDLVSSGESTSRSNSSFRLMRLLRLGRVVRVVRIVRVVRLFRALRTLVYSLLGTLKSLFWSFLLLTLIMYIFGILFTDVVLNYLMEHEGDHDELQLYFGSLYSSVVTLFRSIANGLTWGQAADSLEETGFFWVQIFHLYVAFCSFALLNVMTGVFCNSAIRAAERDHDTVVQNIVQTRKDFKKLARQLFERIDTHRMGHLTITEFEKHFDDQAVRAFFDFLQIGAIDAWTLFVSLDMDGDHTITEEEFTERCMQLHGPARSADLFSLKLGTAKVTRQLQQIRETQQRMESQVFQLQQFPASNRSSRFTV